ncbi:CCR4-NOT core subunit [Martiniozyma asiatica (nom. inval.)]|nr:CCR4-NOT core subunit [Martiniozyma asiatica]
MSNQRKLLQEMDRVFKKITEGLEIFDSIYDRHQNASNSSQKDKLENDLKKEIKKLQRFREQVKNWQTASEIKDKTQLLEHRKLVEVAMEKYKEVEKGSKLKAYSDISLAAVEKEEIDNEAVEFVRNSLDSLQQQTEGFEAEIDKLTGGNGKKSKKKDFVTEERKRELVELLSTHQWHTEKLEIILRLLQNEIIPVEDVMELSDDIQYYIDENQNPDFMYDDSIYDELDLENADKSIANEVHINNILDETVSENQEDNDGGNGNYPVVPPPQSSLSSPSPSPSISVGKKLQKKKTEERSKSVTGSVPPGLTNIITSSSTVAGNTGSVPVISTPIPTPTPTAATSSLISPTGPSISTSSQYQQQSASTPFQIGTSSSNHVTMTTLKPAPAPVLPATEMKWSAAVGALKESATPTEGKLEQQLPSLPSQQQQQQQQSLEESKLNSTPTKVNTNAINAASVLEALKKQKPTSLMMTQAPAGPTENEVEIPHTNVNAPTAVPATAATTSATNNKSPVRLPDFPTLTQRETLLSPDFRFLPSGIQSFILSLGQSFDIDQILKNGNLLNDHFTHSSKLGSFRFDGGSGLLGVESYDLNAMVQNYSYLSKFEQIEDSLLLSKGWNNVSHSNKLDVSTLGAGELLYGWFYGLSYIERCKAAVELGKRGWAIELSTNQVKLINDEHDLLPENGTGRWFLPKNVKNEGLSSRIGSWEVFNVHGWKTSEISNVRVDYV